MLYIVYCAERNTLRRTFSTSEPQSAPSLRQAGRVSSATAVCWTLEYSACTSPQYLLWPLFMLGRSGIPRCVWVCRCAGLSLAAEERARMTRVQLFATHFNIILAKAVCYQVLRLRDQTLWQALAVIQCGHMNQYRVRPPCSIKHDPSCTFTKTLEAFLVSHARVAGNRPFQRYWVVIITVWDVTPCSFVTN